jgi:anaerobic selenocysteine-containing dehydrogenase
MSEWKKTGCVLCAQNCGLEVLIENNRIARVRPDRENPRSEGYSCRKGLNIAHFQHHAQRLRHPLKRVGWKFEPISWEQALDEIAEKLRTIVHDHGPRSLAFMGGGGQGCHFEAAFAVSLLQGLGSRYHYNAMAQELTGMFWVNGRAFGRQYLHTIPDERETDLLLAIGWNGWMSHQMPQARRRLKEIADDPDKLLVVVDPRLSETARRADIHLPIRPGTDALFTRAMIAIILGEGWHDAGYLSRHASGFEEILPWFTGFDARAALRVCELDYEKVREVCRLFATRRSSCHPDLGTLMGRHSTVTSYLQVILLAICGRIGVPGGNVFPGTVMPLGSQSDERKPKTWRTMATDIPAIMGYFPPNVLPEEILSPAEERIRAVLVSGSNPLRSYADTTAYEEACGRLELLVTLEVALSETAALSHYVLPARSAYEKWDGTFFAWTYPEVYFQMRRPVVEAEGDCLEEGSIYTGLAERLGLIPEVPEALRRAARADRGAFLSALFGFVQEDPKAMRAMPFVLAKTLGQELGSAHLAALWGLLQTAPAVLRENAARAGFAPGPNLAEEVFRAILDHPEGLWVGRCEPAENLKSLQTEDRRIELHIPEFADWIRGIDAAGEEAALKPHPDFPLVLTAGRHMDMNANTLMRDPVWNEGRRACTLAMHPRDAEAFGLRDGERARITTEAASMEVEVEVTESGRPGHVVIPHGFGLEFEGRTSGVNVNRLTKNTHRDPWAGTPLHRYVPCRVEPLG